MMAAIRKTNLLVKGRSSIIVKYLLGFLALGMVQLLDLAPENLEEADFSFLHLALLLAYMAAGMFLAVSFVHFIVASCRNRTSFFPENGKSAVFKYFLASIALSFITVICWVISSLPAGGILLSGMLDNPETQMLGFALMIPASFLSFFGALIPMMRFSFVLPAIAVGDDYTYSRAWQMTKGHVVRLFTTGVIVGLPVFLTGMGIGYVFDQGEGLPLAADLFIIILDAAWWAWMYVFFGVLYEDLNNRYEAMTKTAPASGGAEPPTDGTAE